MWGFPGGSDGKESACNVGDLSSMLGLGRSPGEGNDYHSSILARRIPWLEEPVSPWGRKSRTQLCQLRLSLTWKKDNLLLYSDRKQWCKLKHGAH